MNRGRGIVATIERRTGITPSGLAFLAIDLVGWIAARLIGSKVLFLMVYGAATLFVVLFIVGKRKPAITARRSQLPSRVREGQTVAVEIEFTSTRRTGSIVFEEELSPLLGNKVRVLVPSLTANGSIKHSYAFTPRLRGWLDVGPMTAIWSDPFGLTRSRLVLKEPEKVIVHPTTQRVHDRVLSREWEDPPIRPPISKPWPTGFEFYGMRDYVPGDDPRRIVWRAVARTGRYLVREAEQGITDRVTLIIDNDARWHTKGDPSDTFETAVRAAASLGVRHLKDGFAVTLETSAGRIAEGLRGSRKQMTFLDEMSKLKRSNKPLSEAIQRVLVDPRRDSHNVLVSPHLDERTAGMLKLLMDRGGSILFVHLLTDESDPASLNRAGALGCQLVELQADAPIDAAFSRTVGAGIR
ncbi:MAG: DUF58 domain-containing protein [Actinomycetota bacterium]|nr:DUF58 domain-containing protein [Actinomycetota bacterium]